MWWKAFIIFCLSLIAVPVVAGPKSFRVKRVKTPIGKPELAAVLRDGHLAALGHKPNKKRLAVAWAQVALENRQGKEVYNYNLGNITSSKSRPFFVKRNRFRAHRNFNEGAADYWKVVHKMCKRSLKYFDRGQPRLAARQLYRCGYYKADPNKYANSMLWLYRYANRKVLPKL